MPGKTIPLSLASGRVVYLTATSLDVGTLNDTNPEQQASISADAEATNREQPVAITMPKFADVADAVTDIAQELTQIFDKARPNELTVEFGVQVSAKSGKLAALIVEGTGEATLKLSLKWTKSSSDGDEG